MPPIEELVVIWSVLAVAYVIFGITGFGSALVASPILAFFIPLNKIVPLFALLDFMAAFTNTFKDRSNVSFAELKRLIPLMIVGSFVGAAILLYTKPDILLPILGFFAVLYALYRLSGITPQTSFSPKAVVPFGFVGGIFSALFGTGGFVYIIYLSGRIQDKSALRATQSMLITLSTFVRAVIFLLVGIYFDVAFMQLFLLMIPAMLIGLFIGRRITVRLSMAHFMKVINCVVLLAGATLLIKYFFIG